MSHHAVLARHEQVGVTTSTGRIIRMTDTCHYCDSEAISATWSELECAQTKLCAVHGGWKEEAPVPASGKYYPVLSNTGEPGGCL